MTEFEKFCIAFLVICGLFLAAGFSFKIGRRTGYNSGYQAGLNEPGKADTVVVVDTFRQEVPVPQYVWLDKPVYIPVHDTTLVHHNDTTWVVLPREVKGYADSTYRLEVSGIQPQLDWIEVYRKTEYITNTRTIRKHWGLGVSAGPGFIYDGKIHGGVGIVAGLQYQF